jgi:hypothetical protein
MHGLIRGRRRSRQSSRRHFRNGQRAAVVRAATAAKLYLEKSVPTLAAAAEACGTNVAYVRAAVALLKAEDPSLLNLAMAGWIPLTGAAAQIGRRAKLVNAYRCATDEDRIAWARAEGAEHIFDVLVAASR